MIYSEIPKVEITPIETLWEKDSQNQNGGIDLLVIRASVSGDILKTSIKKKKYLLIEETEFKKISKRPKSSNPLMAELESFD